MTTLASPIDRNLRAAGYLLLLEIAFFVVVSMILERNGFSSGLAFIGLWLFNLVTAWHLSKAANEFGKNKWLFGIMAAIGPPLAILAFTILNLHNSIRRLNDGSLPKNGSALPDSKSIAPWIYALGSGYIFGAIISALLALLGVTHFEGDRRGEHIGFTTLLFGAFCLLSGYAAYVRLSKRNIHPLTILAVFALGAISAILLLTWLYTRHVT